MTIRQVLSNTYMSISEFKKNPMSVLDNGNSEPVAILYQNQPIFLCRSSSYLRIVKTKVR